MSDTRSYRSCFAQSVAQRGRCAVLGLIATVPTSTSLAQPDQPLELRWAAPTNCPQQGEVHEQIQKIVGTQRQGEHMVRLRATGVIELISDRFQLTLTIREGDTTGARVISSDDCGSLGKAAAVVLGLLIRQERKLGRALSDSEISGVATGLPSTAEGAPGISTSNGTVDHQTGAPSGSDDPRELDRSRNSHLHLLLHGPTVHLDIGTLPSLSYGVGLGAGIAHGPWHALASGVLWFPQTVRSSSVPVYEAGYSRTSVALMGCRGWRWSPFELAPCLQFAVDIVSASASGDRIVPQSRVGAWAYLGGGLTAHWHFSRRASLFVRGIGQIATHRPSFVVDGDWDSTLAYRVRPASLLTSIGCAWIF